MKAERYSIGSDVWPGLSKLIEECGELQQVMGKILATGGDPHHWDGSNLVQRMEEEIGDVLAAIGFVVFHTKALDFDAIAHRSQEKRLRFEQWHEEQS